MQQPVEIFFSYAHEDEELMDDVRRQLVVYDRQHLIVKWYDRLIPAGEAWAGEIDEHLRQARVILLFVSPHFIESEYCYQVEMAEALRRHEAGEAALIPIILRPCPWRDSPIGRLQALPKDGRAVTLWQNRDEACLNVAEGVMQVVRSISVGETPGLNAREEAETLHTARNEPALVLTGRVEPARPYNPCLHRLEREAARMREMVGRVPSIQIVQTEGEPPVTYLLQYNMDGVASIDEDENPLIVKEHLVEMRVHDGYPMSLPFTQFITPMFHPNVSDNGNVCMGWFTLPYSLPEVCVHIAEMIDYQIYDVSMPTDHKAADWAKRHSSLFPLTNWGVRAPAAAAKPSGVRIKAVEQERIEIALHIHATGEVYRIDIPADMIIRELKSSLLDELNLPRRLENGRLVEYRLSSKALSRELIEDLTLRENGVPEGDRLSFSIEMVAG